MSDRRREELNRLAAKAREKHERLLHLKTLELLLGSMIRIIGVSAVRQLLLRYVNDLGEFDVKGDP